LYQLYQKIKGLHNFMRRGEKPTKGTGRIEDAAIDGFPIYAENYHRSHPIQYNLSLLLVSHKR
jgi:hypothetical protein